jgi:hypothetical protein
MLSLSKSEAKEWCARHGVAVDDRNPILPEHSTIVPIPEEAGARIALVQHQTSSFTGETEVLVWFTDWGVSPSAERAHIFDRFRASYGETRPLGEVPAYVFSGSEIEDMVSFVTLGVLFLWDVDVIGGSGESMLLYSHGEYCVAWGTLTGMESEEEDG